jgi:hypothetical protein
MLMLSCICRSESFSVYMMNHFLWRCCLSLDVHVLVLVLLKERFVYFMNRFSVVVLSYILESCFRVGTAEISCRAKAFADYLTPLSYSLSLLFFDQDQARSFGWAWRGTGVSTTAGSAIFNYTHTTMKPFGLEWRIVPLLLIGLRVGFSSYLERKILVLLSVA